MLLIVEAAGVAGLGAGCAILISQCPWLLRSVLLLLCCCGPLDESH